jgi:hypothetical protein
MSINSISLNKSSIYNKSVFGLLLSNIIIIILALFQDWNILTVLFVYWSQSVIIGFFNYLKILNLKNFSVGGLKLNGISAEKILKDNGEEHLKKMIGKFFCFHYGFFHFVYFMFLVAFISIFNMNQEYLFIIIGAVIFFIDHYYSYKYNQKNDLYILEKVNIGKLMLFPYIRIIPMHLCLIFGIFLIQSRISLLIFLILKTIADVFMHIHQHNLKG